MTHKLALGGFVILAALLIAPLFISAQDTAPASYIYCPNLTQSLSFGMRDSQTSPRGQVTELQRFLTDYYDLNPDDYVTGYFGRLTRDNVRRFQCERMSICSGNESTTGYGVVGPKTRVAIARVCGESRETPPGPPPTSIGFSAHPLLGSAPLTVNFMYPGTNPDQYTIDYGDGSSGTMTLIHTPCSPLAKCSPSFLSSHTYVSAGSYTAKLLKNPGNCVQLQTYPPQTVCSPAPVVASVTITVRGASVPPTPISCGPRDTFAPVCGHYPGWCPSQGEGGPNIGAPCSAPRDRTYLNQCELADAGSTFLHSGTCTGQPLQPLLVLSPHGGETYVAGSPITISWQAPRPDSATTHINVSLGSIPKPTPPCIPVTSGNMTTTCAANAGSIQLIPGTITGTSYTWTIPQSYANAPGQYRIYVGWSDTDIEMSAYSGTFTIQ